MLMEVVGGVVGSDGVMGAVLLLVLLVVRVAGCGEWMQKLSWWGKRGFLYGGAL